MFAATTPAIVCAAVRNCRPTLTMESLISVLHKHMMGIVAQTACNLMREATVLPRSAQRYTPSSYRMSKLVVGPAWRNNN